MKQLKKIFVLIFIILALGISFLSCVDAGSDEGSGEGTLTVQIANAATFSNHSIYYAIYDSDAIVNGAPAGNMLGNGIIDVVSGAGSYVTLDASDYSTQKVFDNGTYYFGGSVDMDDDFNSTGYTVDSGDRYGDFVTVEINDNTILTITESNFDIVEP